MQIENIFKLVELAGNQHRYQYMVAICCFLFWCNINVLDICLGILEITPKVKYIVQETGEEKEENLDYELCETKNYTIIERPKYSLVSELGIECDQLKVSILGTLVSIGLLLGALTYSYITKALGQKNSLLISNFIFVLVLGLSIVIKNYYYVCFTMLICPYMCNIISYSTMVLFSEIISEKRKSIFNTFINSGLGLGGLFYTAFFYGIQYWWGVFSVCVGIGVLLEIFVMFFIFNSFYDLNKKKDFKGIMKVLRFIAKINRRLGLFNEEIKNGHYQEIIEKMGYIEDEYQKNKEESSERITKIRPEEKKDENQAEGKMQNYNNEKMEEKKEIEEPDIENEKPKQMLNGDKSEPLIENKKENESESLIKKKENTNTSTSEKPKPGILSLFKYSSVRTPFFLFSFFWLSGTALYNGLTIGLKNLPGNLFTNATIFFSIETPAYFVLGWIMNTELLGRKYTLMLFTALSTINYIIIFFLFDEEKIKQIFFLINRFHLACVFSSFYTFALESYPLSIAQLAYGINGACNCLGGVVLPFILEFVTEEIQYIIFMSLGIACVCLQFLLKETRGKVPRDEIEELESEEIKNKEIEENEENEENEKKEKKEDRDKKFIETDLETDHVENE